MAAENTNKNFIKQTGILVAAGLLCRVIGVLYRTPLTMLIGTEGNGYYGAAYNIYAIVLLVSSYSIPSALSKEISGRLSMHEYKNAQKFFRGALIYILAVGGICSVFLYVAAPYFMGENGTEVLQIFSPCIILSGLLGVFHGYFQSFNSMVQTSVSQILEQIINALASVGLAYCFIRLLSGRSDTDTAVHGAMGSAAGTVSGVLFALLFMLWIYRKNKSFLQKKIRSDNSSEIRYRRIFRIIIHTVTPIVFCTFIYNLSISLDQMLYLKVLSFRGISEKALYLSYGSLSGKAMVIQNIPVAMVSSVASALIPQIAGIASAGLPENNRAAGMAADTSGLTQTQNNNLKKVQQKINLSRKMSYIICIPAVVGIFILAEPILALLFPQKERFAEAVLLLRIIDASILFTVSSTLYNAVLQGIGKVNTPVKNAAAALAVQSIVLILLLSFTSLGIYAVAIVSFLYALLMSLLNGFAVKKELACPLPWKKYIAKPFLAAGVMGVLVWCINSLLARIGCILILRLGISIAAGAAVYFLILIYLNVMTKEEIRRIIF